MTQKWYSGGIADVNGNGRYREDYDGCWSYASVPSKFVVQCPSAAHTACSHTSAGTEGQHESVGHLEDAIPAAADNGKKDARRRALALALFVAAAVRHGVPVGVRRRRASGLEYAAVGRVDGSNFAFEYGGMAMLHYSRLWPSRWCTSGLCGHTRRRHSS